MKKIFFLMIGSMMVLYGCNNDPKVAVNPDKFVASEWLKGSNDFIFPNHTDTLVLNKAENDLFFDTIKWTPADFGYSAAITYAIQMAVKKDDGTFSDFKTVAVSTKPFYALKVNDINAYILNAGGIKRRQTDVQTRIAATISSFYPPQYSDVFAFTATTYSLDPDMLFFMDAQTGLKVDSTAFAPKWNGQYDGYVYLPHSQSGIWLVEEVNPETRWGIASSTAQGNSLKLIKESNGGQPIMSGAFGAGNMESSLVDSGYYKVSVNLQPASAPNNTIQVWRFYNDFFICGQRNMKYKEWGMNMSGQFPKMPAWNVNGTGKLEDYFVMGTGAKLTYYPAERVWKTDVVFVPKFQTVGPPSGALPPFSIVENTSAFEFKLRANWSGTFNVVTGAATSSWLNAANLGGSQNDLIGEDGAQRGNISGTGNIKFNGTPGYYWFVVHLNEYPPYKYELIPVQQ